jgi:hypothetical protein
MLAHVWLQHACRTSDRVVAISEFIARRLPAGVKPTRVYDPVRGAAAALDGPRDAERIVCVGNYIRGKGQDDALEAFARIAARFPRARLDFYGGDMGLEKNRQFREELVASIRRHGLEERVTLHGFARDVRAIFGSARIALNFSHSEAFSLTCLEAAQHGCALIATRCGGPEEIVADGATGLLVDVSDHAAMADAQAQRARAQRRERRRRPAHKPGRVPPATPGSAPRFARTHRPRSQPARRARDEAPETSWWTAQRRERLPLLTRPACRQNSERDSRCGRARKRAGNRAACHSRTFCGQTSVNARKIRLATRVKTTRPPPRAMEAQPAAAAPPKCVFRCMRRSAMRF